MVIQKEQQSKEVMLAKTSNPNRENGDGPTNGRTEKRKSRLAESRARDSKQIRCTKIVHNLLDLFHDCNVFSFTVVDSVESGNVSSSRP